MEICGSTHISIAQENLIRRCAVWSEVFHIVGVSRCIRWSKTNAWRDNKWLRCVDFEVFAIRWCLIFLFFTLHSLTTSRPWSSSHLYRALYICYSLLIAIFLRMSHWMRLVIDYAVKVIKTTITGYSKANGNRHRSLSTKKHSPSKNWIFHNVRSGYFGGSMDHRQLYEHTICLFSLN